ncbi:hypothetical protein BCR32DRAFT_294232 [Anaeromyces robustus]|uniref:RRM domain-containing protein n=1 Tax=Anaeromyces robustus TaxID=1754192 RepID=A0A1Y1X295_9FUNG|nr:hypothetical protein BCR32DRAFT_294232 [Anaeromyces robustus]|eukprot:ORX79785.1 hypothetical protein BCR32DRAFT_294232 [Anaeromyces robustus]
MVITRSHKRLRNEIVEEELKSNTNYESLSSSLSSSDSSDSSPVPSILKKLKEKNSIKPKRKIKKSKSIYEEVDIRNRIKKTENIRKTEKLNETSNLKINNINRNKTDNSGNDVLDENEKAVEKENQYNIPKEQQQKKTLKKRKKDKQDKNYNKQDNYRRALLKKQIFKSRIVDTFRPFNIADSPVLKRTVDLRNTMVRRSSMNLRGKRKSSAYGGLCPPPLPNTRSSSFYRFIEFEQPEPIKMKQLLLWCAERTIQEQNSNNNNSKNESSNSENSKSGNTNQNNIPKSISNKVKEIQEELMEELMSNKIEVSWYNREKSPDEQERLKGKNKINIDNEKKLIEFQEKLEKLKKEKNEWSLNYEYYKQKHEDFIKRDTNKPIIIDSNIVNIDTLMASVNEEEFNKINMLLSHKHELENEKSLSIEEVEHILIPQIEDSLHHLIELKNTSQDICKDVNNKISNSYKQNSSNSLESASFTNTNINNYSERNSIDPQSLLRAISSKMDIDSKVNMSLDDIVKNSRRRNNRRVINSNRNNRSIKSRLSNNGNNSKKSIPRGNINGKWKHDLFTSNNSNTSKRSILTERAGRIQKRLSRNGLITAKKVAGLPTSPKRKQTSTIQITNLHPNANTEDIKTIFREFGEIVNIILKRDINGNSTGVCEIEYANRQSSIDAIAKYNGIIADGQKLSVAEIQRTFSIAGVAKPTTTQKPKLNVKGMYADRMAEQKRPSVLSHGNTKTKFHITL